MKDINTFINTATHKRRLTHQEFDKLYPKDVDSSAVPVHVMYDNDGNIAWAYDDEFETQYYNNETLL